MSKLIKMSLAAASMAFASSASAVVVTDTIGATNVVTDPYIAYMDYEEGTAAPWFGGDTTGYRSYTIYHDLTDNGVPSTHEVNWANLTLSFADDLGKCFGVDCASDMGSVSFTGSYDSWELDGVVDATLSGLTYDIKTVGLTDEGLVDLNGDGLLAVTVTALDNGCIFLCSVKGSDFYWKESVLTADISEIPTVEVPAPAGFLLLGLGLAGFGVSRRIKAKA